MTTLEARDTINGFLSAIWGSPATLDSTGAYEIASEEGVPCLIEVVEDEEELRLYSPIFSSPDFLSYQVLHEALSLNLFQYATAGGCLAIDSRTGGLALTSKTPVNDMRQSDFETLLNNFIDTAIAIQQRLIKTLQAIEPISGADVTADAPPFMHNLA